MSKLIYFDTEDTGLLPGVHGLIEIGYIIEIDGVVKKYGSLKMNPVGASIDLEALKVNGYTLEDLQKLPSSESQFKEFLKVLDTYIDKYDAKDKFYPVGHNIQFDIDFVNHWFRANGNNFLNSYLKSGKAQIIDTLSLIPFLQVVGKLPSMENHKLETLCSTLGVSLENAHTALADIEATRSCFLIMKEMVDE